MGVTLALRITPAAGRTRAVAIALHGINDYSRGLARRHELLV